MFQINDTVSYGTQGVCSLYLCNVLFLYAIKQNHKTTEFQFRNPVVFITVLLRLLTINQEKDIINLWILSIILQR